MGFLSGKRVMVTGGAGFLGRFLVEELKRYGPLELGVPRRRDYDLRRQDDVARAYAAFRPDVVVHLAATVGGIGANAQNPGTYFYDNALMGIHLIEGARASGVSKLVTVGTICSYPKHTPVPFKESELWNGYPEETNAPYGIAKKSLIAMGQAYRKQFGLNVIDLLPVNLYGPGDNFDPQSCHVVPALITKVLDAVKDKQESITAWGTGKASREFLFVRDAADAIARATEYYNGEWPINIGSGREITIQGLVREISDICGFQGDVLWDTTKPDGQPRRCLDTSLAYEHFGFRAATPLREGLRETITWYESNCRNQP